MVTDLGGGGVAQLVERRTSNWNVAKPSLKRCETFIETLRNQHNYAWLSMRYA